MIHNMYSREGEWSKEISLGKKAYSNMVLGIGWFSLL